LRGEGRCAKENWWCRIASGLASFAVCCRARRKRGGTRGQEWRPSKADLAMQSGAITPVYSQDTSVGRARCRDRGKQQMPACSSNQIRRTGEWSQGSQLDWRRGIVIGVLWPPSSNLLEPRSRFIQARHTAARANEKIEGCGSERRGGKPPTGSGEGSGGCTGVADREARMLLS